MISRRQIDWKKTGERLQDIRDNDISLRRYVCQSLFPKRPDKFLCDGSECKDCTSRLDPFISRKELAQVFNVSPSLIENWEYARSVPSLEDLYYYCDICGITLEEILVFDD